MSHEDPAEQQDNQFFPTDTNGDVQDCSSDEGACVVFRYNVGGGFYTDMTMSQLFPAEVDIDNPDAFPPHLYAVWEEQKELGQLAFDAAYIVPAP